jgi:hypothetical protein
MAFALIFLFLFASRQKEKQEKILSRFSTYSFLHSLMCLVSTEAHRINKKEKDTGSGPA